MLHRMSTSPGSHLKLAQLVFVNGSNLHVHFRIQIHKQVLSAFTKQQKFILCERINVPPVSLSGTMSSLKASRDSVASSRNKWTLVSDIQCYAPPLVVKKDEIELSSMC
ncbi:hypothetical protein EYF80_033436 [Liparis tanakae]|uniref:Uncharacterized protein n=1 Tax=Liparis tanakae TaxID=230148 RepID=A0A4Z2GTA0_9TELE|nr:hypothetical protein EYF80_033436 [Liparis tanakae]